MACPHVINNGDVITKGRFNELLAPDLTDNMFQDYTLCNLVHKFIDYVAVNSTRKCNHGHSEFNIHLFIDIINTIYPNILHNVKPNFVNTYRSITGLDKVDFNIENFSDVQDRLRLMDLIDIEYRHINVIKERAESKLWIKRDYKILNEWIEIDNSDFTDQFMVYNRYLKIIENGDINPIIIKDELDRLNSGHYDGSVKSAIEKMIALFRYYLSHKDSYKTCKMLDAFEDMSMRWPRGGDKHVVRYPDYILPFLTVLSLSSSIIVYCDKSDEAHDYIYRYGVEYETKTKLERLQVYRILYDSLEKGDRSCLCYRHQIYDLAINKDNNENQKVSSPQKSKVKTKRHVKKKRKGDPFSYLNNVSIQSSIDQRSSQDNPRCLDITVKTELDDYNTIKSQEKIPTYRKHKSNCIILAGPHITYHSRVSRWFHLKLDETIPFEDYSLQSSVYQSTMIFLHNFIPGMDRIINNTKYTYRFGSRYYLLVKYQHLKLHDKPNLGVIEYCFDNNKSNGQCYHRFINKQTPSEMVNLVTKEIFTTTADKNIKEDKILTKHFDLSGNNCKMKMSVDQIFETVTFSNDQSVITVYPKNK